MPQNFELNMGQDTILVLMVNKNSFHRAILVMRGSICLFNFLFAFFDQDTHNISIVMVYNGTNGGQINLPTYFDCFPIMLWAVTCRQQQHFRKYKNTNSIFQ